MSYIDLVLLLSKEELSVFVRSKIDEARHQLLNDSARNQLLNMDEDDPSASAFSEIVSV